MACDGVKHVPQLVRGSRLQAGFSFSFTVFTENPEMHGMYGMLFFLSFLSGDGFTFLPTNTEYKISDYFDNRAIYGENDTIQMNKTYTQYCASVKHINKTVGHLKVFDLHRDVVPFCNFLKLSLDLDIIQCIDVQTHMTLQEYAETSNVSNPDRGGGLSRRLR